MDLSLIANSGIQLQTFPLRINTQEKFRQWYREWYDEAHGEWLLEPVYELRTEHYTAYYDKAELYRKGYLASITGKPQIDPDDLRHDGIEPLRTDDEMRPGVEGEIFSMSFTDKDFHLAELENKWLPLPYFFKRSERRMKFGPLNWVRFKLMPCGEENGEKLYNVVLAFDTHTTYEEEGINENPVFPDKFCNSINFELCGNEIMLMDYCATGKPYSYIEKYIFNTVHPGVSGVSALRVKQRKTGYIASYIFLLTYLGTRGLFPKVTLFKDVDVVKRDVDMVVDIGNSRTTVLLIEDNSSFNQVKPLVLQDFTDPVKVVDGEPCLKRYNEPFDMRVAFRKETFGGFGLKDSPQFVYPSLLRLGREAVELLHKTSGDEIRPDTLSTYSSPKRYLWDWRPNREEWMFTTLPGEDDSHILHLQGVSNQLTSDGKFDPSGNGGLTYHYSRRSLMTFSFLEMLNQAIAQINSPDHRSVKTGFGHPETPRTIKRIIITCPTAMSKEERNALIICAKDAVAILDNRYRKPGEPLKPLSAEVVPSLPSFKDSEDGAWFYDEATCAQLVYMYGEVGHKYKGCSQEFFSLYGKKIGDQQQPSLTVGSLDIGAGTSDLMISNYTYKKGAITTITPDPLFYDSYYFAGDDMLNGMIKNIMLLDESSAFRRRLSNLSNQAYRQKIKDFFGEDWNGQAAIDRILRKDFNIQYSVPLMCHFLELLKNDSPDRTVKYSDVFDECPPNKALVEGFKERMGIDITDLEWNYNSELVKSVVMKEFEPLLKRIATIMYAYACDIVLLSGRPASLGVIRDIFLKYYSVSPDRLIVLNNYYVGDWYPFSHNTGYVTNPKTIVAMGGILAHYASELSNLNKFVIDLEKLKKNIKSTVNYIEESRDGMPVEYFLTPERNSGEVVVSRIPAVLKVRQLGLDSYPSRTLYTIDFNTYRLADAVRRKALLEDGETLTDARCMALVNERIDTLKKRMPFTLTIEREPDDKESLTITSIVDKNDNEVADSNLEIHIQSLGADEKYWLDSGAFNF